MEEMRLNILMMGKTGHGKSATGNMILNRDDFETSNNTTSQTKDVSNSFGNFNDFMLLVVDGPGLEDTDLTEDKDKEEAAKNMDKALVMCYGGVDAFLLVYRFNTRMTREERAALDALKKIFGDSFMNHVIVVVTYGDQFHGAMEEEGSNLSFHDWCREQTGEFRQLLQDCDGRIVLVNNKETDVVMKREQVRQIVELTHELQSRSGRYTSLCFQLAEQERQKLILQQRAPHLQLEIQEKMCILYTEVCKLSEKSSDSKKKKVKDRIIALKCKIKAEVHDCVVLGDLHKHLERMESCLNNLDMLLYLSKELEKIRRAKFLWNCVGKVCSIYRGVLCVLAPYAGKWAANPKIAARLHDLSITEHEFEQQKKEMEEQRNELRRLKEN